MAEKTLPASLKLTARRARLLLLALMNLTGIMTTSGIFLRLLFRENLSLTALTGALMPFIFLPACLFLLLSIVLRGWLTAALNLTPALLFLVMYGVYLLPRPSAADGGNEITFLTYNLHTDPAMQEIQAAVIREANADVIALQEVSEATENYFRTALADAYPYQIFYTAGMSVLGRGVLSRYPLANDKLLSSDGREIVLRMEVVPEDGSENFTVYNVHLSPPDWGGIITYNADFRRANMQALLKLAAEETQPLVILGDFNASDASDDYTIISSHYSDACRERCQGLAVTFPATEEYPFPANLLPSLIRLDYVFYDDRWQAHSAEVWHSAGGSDHRPFKAVLALIAGV